MRVLPQDSFEVDVCNFRGASGTQSSNQFAEERSVATCEKCGNEYDKCFEVVIQGQRHVFDSFECAIQAVAPTCGHCLCRIIGHGVEVGEHIFCCAHCAGSAGLVNAVQDRAA